MDNHELKPSVFIRGLLRIYGIDSLGRTMSICTLEKATSREAAYENAGHYVVDNCDFLIAIWNGKPASGQGGTGDIVEYARKVCRHIFWINSENGNIKEENVDR